MTPPRWIDERAPLERSCLLRYERFLRRCAGPSAPRREDLEACSLGAEGLRLVELPSYKGVSLRLLDLSSRTATGTVKSLSASYIVAAMRRRAVRAFVVLSSGNKANSLRLYALARGISVVSVVPARSWAKLRAVPRPAAGARDILVRARASSDEAMKAFGRKLAAELGLPCQPVLADYAASDRARAAAYVESLQRGAKPCTHFFQPVSSNYGLYGTYLGLAALARQGAFAAAYPIPVGVQQEAVAPLYDVFERGLSPDEAFLRAERGYAGRGVFERTLFTTHPATVAQNRWLKRRFKARFLTVNLAGLRRRYAAARGMLADGGVALPAKLADLPEKSGVLGVVSALEAAENGWLAAGDRVLLHFTGGIETLSPLAQGAAVVEVDADADDPARTARRLGPRLA